MALILDCDVSSLLCAEENERIYFGDVVVEEYHSTNLNDIGGDQNQNFEVEEGFMSGLLPLLSDECVDSMFAKECEHLPARDYLQRLRNGDLNLKARQEAVDWIEKAHSHFGFGPLCAYLSVNYLDRFLSAYDYELLTGKECMMQLLAVACLSLAAKMEETEVPQCLNLQVGESKFLFEAKTIRRMELLVLSTLKWRMQSITPFSFIDYFLTKMKGDHIGSRLPPIYKSTRLILSMIKGIDLLEFRPSDIAAAAALSVVGENQTVDTEKALHQLDHYLRKDRVAKCVEVMKKSSSLSSSSEISCNGSNGSIRSSLSRNLIGVIDAACISSRSQEIKVESCVPSSHYSENAKRRKLN